MSASDSMLPNTETYPVICIDGPSGAGKGTVARRLAQDLGYQLLDSGALYRIVGLKAHQLGLLEQSDNLDEDALEALTKSLDIHFSPSESLGRVDIIVNDELIGNEVRNETVGGYASQVAVFPKVRQALLALQQDMALRSGLVADGRDMGTVVFPNANVKVFLTASAEARAERRVLQLQNSGQHADKAEILANIQARDVRDEKRSTAPSKAADDALLIDSSALSAEAVYTEIKRYCQDKGICF